MGKAAFVASRLSVCQPLQLHLRLKPLSFTAREEKYPRADPGTEVSPLLLFISWKSLRRGVGDSSSSALGGTVAVVSPALSRPSSANESAAGSAAREEGRGLLRPCCPSPASSPYYPPSPFQGKMESCFRLLHHQEPQCLPRKRPRLRTWQHRAAIITVPVGIMTATVGESFPTGRKEGRPFWV